MRRRGERGEKIYFLVTRALLLTVLELVTYDFTLETSR